MEHATGTSADFARYLRLLGVPARPPGLDALAEIVSAHLARVPFENVSKLLFRRDPSMRLPVLPRWLDGIERYRFGGTCYANNSHLCELLLHLGYDVRLCGADMSAPDVHVVGVVTLDGREWLVDVGYGAPFHAPMALDGSSEHVMALGEERWVLRPRDAEGRSRMELWRDGTERHGYRLNPAPRRIEEFRAVVEASFRPEATFMNALAIVRFFPGRSEVLHNMTLIECEGLTCRRRAAARTRDELPDAIETRFGMPRERVREALAGIPLTHDAWS